MASSPTPSLRIEKQGTGDNITTWGQRLNDNGLELIEDAIAGVITKSLTGNYTLTVANYAPDEARNAALIFTDGGLSANATVTIPAVQKLYYVENRGATYSITFTAGGVTGTLPAARKGLLICNGTDITIFDPKADSAASAAAAAASEAAAQADATQTGLDRTQTGLDRVQTGLDRIAAAASAAAAAVSAGSVDGPALAARLSALETLSTDFTDEQIALAIAYTGAR